MDISLSSVFDPLAKKAKDLKSLVFLRFSAEKNNDLMATLQDIGKMVSDIEVQMKGIRERVRQESDVEYEEIRELSAKQLEYITQVKNNLPARLPGNVKKKTIQIEMEEVVKGQQQQLQQPQPSQPKSARTRSSKAADTTEQKVQHKLNLIPKISYVTVDELDSVPSYMRGRLNQDKMNSAVDALNSLVEEKYTFLAQPSNRNSKKYKKYREMENKKTKGVHFFAKSDILEKNTFKLDNTGTSILIVLRHLGKLREIRDGADTNIKYVVSI